MKIDKAIEILTDHRELILVDKNPDLKDAVKLGIEALKRCQAYKEVHFAVPYVPMLGEEDEK